MIKWCELVYSNIQLCTVVCSGFLGHFSRGDLQTRASNISLILDHLG
jgi:hypothetical protein